LTHEIGFCTGTVEPPSQFIKDSEPQSLNVLLKVTQKTGESWDLQSLL